jgi:hypothetical protein
MTAILGILVIRSSLVDWWSMKKECRHARHNRTSNIGLAPLNFRYSISYRNDQNLSDKSGRFFTFFESFFTKFVPFWCWPPCMLLLLLLYSTFPGVPTVLAVQLLLQFLLLPNSGVLILVGSIMYCTVLYNRTH